MDTVTDNSMEPRWPKRFTPVWNPPDVVLEQVHAQLLPTWDTNVGKKKTLKLSGKVGSICAWSERWAQKAWKWGHCLFHSHEQSFYVSYIHGNGILQTWQVYRKNTGIISIIWLSIIG